MGSSEPVKPDGHGDMVKVNLRNRRTPPFGTEKRSGVVVTPALAQSIMFVLDCAPRLASGLATVVGESCRANVDWLKVDVTEGADICDEGLMLKRYSATERNLQLFNF